MPSEKEEQAHACIAHHILMHERAWQKSIANYGSQPRRQPSLNKASTTLFCTCLERAWHQADGRLSALQQHLAAAAGRAGTIHRLLHLLHGETLACAAKQGEMRGRSHLKDHLKGMRGSIRAAT